MTNTVKLRAHHLDSAEQVHGKSREGFVDILWETGYIWDDDMKNFPEHPFVSLAYDSIKELFSNPDRKLLIVNDEVDYICKKCPLRKEECEITEKEHAHKVFGKAFFDYFDSKDSNAARRLGLNLGESYTVKDLRERLRF